MARGATPWTEVMDNFLADGEWHSMEEVLAVGAAEVPAERALEEMGKNNRAQQSDESRRITAGQKTLAQQSLMGMKRFGKVEITGSKPDQRVRRLSAASVSPGVLVERVTVLETQVAALLAWQTKISGSESVAVEWLREKEELNSQQERARMIEGVVSDLRDAPDAGDSENDPQVEAMWVRERTELSQSGDSHSLKELVSDADPYLADKSYRDDPQTTVEQWPSSVGMLDREYGTDVR